MEKLTEKIIFAGSMGSGKTTAIKAISEISPVMTEVENNDLEQHEKTMTTMALDYGLLTLDDGTKLVLYGTPGQERLSFMWPIIARGALGVIILIANDQDDPISNLALYLDRFSDLIATSGAVIGITCTDKLATTKISDYQKYLQSRSLILPVFTVDMRKKQDVLLLLNGLLSTCEANRANEGLT